MRTAPGARLPRVAAVISGAVARCEFRSAFQSQADMLWVLANIGELRDSPFLGQLDLLVVDLTTDPQSKLSFIDRLGSGPGLGVVVLLPAGTGAMRRAALKSGVDACVEASAGDRALQSAVRMVWVRIQDGRQQRCTRAAPLSSPAQRLAERLARARPAGPKWPTGEGRGGA